MSFRQSLNKILLSAAEKIMPNPEPEIEVPENESVTSTSSYHNAALIEIVSLIEQNGGPTGLNLSGKDLSGADLSSEAVWTLMNQRGIAFVHEYPVWVTETTWGKTLVGLNLKEANLQRANLQRANLEGANLIRANLENADLRDARLKAAILYRANLQKARLWRADLRNVSAMYANFEHASLYRVEFLETNLVKANMKNTFLIGANLSKAQLRAESLGEQLLQETAEPYRDHLQWDDPTMSDGEWERYFFQRLARARDIYAELRNSFVANGYHEDASWAHYKERRLTREMHRPDRARQYYKDIYPNNGRFQIAQKTWFYIRFLWIWLLMLVTEITSGYGERPWRTVFASLAIVILFPLLYWLSGGIKIGSGNAILWYDYLTYSLGAFTTVGFTRFHVVTWFAELLTGIEAILGVSMLALLMFSLGNRISRF